MLTHEQLSNISITGTWIANHDDASWRALREYKDKWLDADDPDDTLNSCIYPYELETAVGTVTYWVLEIECYALGHLTQGIVEALMMNHRGNLDMLITKHGGAIVRYEQTIRQP